MISPRVLRRRIKSIQGTAKITRAMEMIATAKMRRTQEAALRGRPYAEHISDVVAHLAASLSTAGEGVPAIMRAREVKRVGIIEISTDRGLCGGLNSNINRMVGTFVLREGKPVSIVSVGRKGRDFIVRNGLELRADFTGMGDRPSVEDILPIARVAMDDYLSGHVDRVYIAYTRFVTTMLQKPVMQQLMPVVPADLPKSQRGEYIYEPSVSGVLESLLPRFVEMELYHAMLEAIASEQSARMVAMRNATENARDMVQELTLALNKARQEMITKELLDIVGGVAALE